VSSVDQLGVERLLQLGLVDEVLLYEYFTEP
jgi:hypothetical protein